MTSKTEVSFVLPFDPMPSPRPQARVIGKFASFYMPRPYVVWKEQVAEYVRSQVVKPDDDVFEGPVRVHIENIVTPPKTTKLPFPSPDIDNYMKSVLDALTESGVVWKDDRQAFFVNSIKRWASPGEAAGIRVVLTYGKP